MSKLAVKYNNDLNSIPLRHFTVNELNIFLTLCANIKEKGCERVTFDFDKLRELAKYESTSVDRFVADLKSTYSKLLATSYTLDDGDVIESFTLFNRYKIVRSEQLVEIEVNENFKYILNDLNLGNFTRFELKEYTDINSTYSKALYMRLKQWKSTGKWEVTLDEFKRVLAVPDSYKMSAIDNRILKPAELDLAPFFTGLEIKKLDRNNKISGKGRPVKKLVFTFQQQDDSVVKIQSNKYALGKYENVWLTEAQHKEVKFDMKKGYLIEQVSEWKHGRKNENHNNDFTLIKKFADNMEKQYTADEHARLKEKAINDIKRMNSPYQEEERVDVNGDIFNQLLIDIEDK